MGEVAFNQELEVIVDPDQHSCVLSHIVLF